MYNLVSLKNLTFSFITIMIEKCDDDESLYIINFKAKN